MFRTGTVLTHGGRFSGTSESDLETRYVSPRHELGSFEEITVDN